MNIVPFDFNKLPDAVARRTAHVTNEVVGNSAGEGFPVISLKGKAFHIQRGDERTLITRPGEDDPAGSIEVVIVRANPNRSKVFYAEGYQEGSVAKPNCYSNDGIAPAADAQEPQSKKCAVCPHNQWGAKIMPDGRKARACSDSRRIAVATPETPNDPMLVRVPAGSMKSLEEYGKMLAARGIAPYTVVTKIGFDHSVAYPSLTFRPVGLVNDEDLLTEIEKARESTVVRRIVGLEPAPEQPPEEGTKTVALRADPVPAPEPAPAPVATKARTDAVEAAVAAAAGTAKAKVKVEADPAPAPAPAAKTVVASTALENEVRGLLEGLDFDDM